MQTIKSLYKPRDSVFAETTRDDVLNLHDLVEGGIDVRKFFEENHKTKGMKFLFETAFKRFPGKSETGVIKLTQAMGGGFVTWETSNVAQNSLKLNLTLSLEDL